MGYYTRFTLSTSTDGVDVDELFNEHGNEYDMKSYDGAVNDGGSMKWYDYDRDMLSLSKAHPTVVFILDGEGEESGDNWRTFYINGQKEEHKAHWIAPDKPEKLAVPEYIAPPKIPVLHVPSGHILHAALDAQAYTVAPVQNGAGDGHTVVVLSEGPSSPTNSLVTVPNSWLDDDA